MCGIYGYFGSSNNAADIVLSGLKKLDYRGYDSWGIALCQKEKIFVQKEIGKIINTPKTNLPKGNLALGHTRWATTGSVLLKNAHPHLSTNNSFALVQNGIVENYQALKLKLIKLGYKFKSQTDTEVIVRLIESFQEKNYQLLDSFQKAFRELEGRNTVALIDLENQRILAIKNGSPLIIGKNQNDYIISSDIVSLSGDISQYYDLNDLDLLVLDGGINITNLQDQQKIIPKFKKIDFKSIQVNKKGHRHYMIKEVLETPEVINQVTKSDPQKIKQLANLIKKANHVYTIGSGTAGNAAAQIAYFLKNIAHIPATALVGANANEYYSFFTKNDLIIAPSQSGETADVLEVLNYAQSKKMTIASFVNMPGSMMTRLSHFKFMANAGPEICVMSTKIFTSQIAWGYLLAKTVDDKYISAIDSLQKLSLSIKNYLSQKSNIDQIKKISQKLVNIKDIFLIGKSETLQIANEGMVKLVEGTYKHAHAIPSGDLKHYAITLIEPNVYTIAISSLDTQKDINNSINEIKSRGGKIISISLTKPENSDFWIKVPNLGDVGSIFSIIPLQILTYYLSIKMGNDVDKPRNIAKSVTVK